MSAEAYLARPFGTLPELIALHAREAPGRRALVLGDAAMDYATLDRAATRIAAGLRRRGLGKGDALAIIAPASLEYVAMFIGALRAGLAVAPISPSLTEEIVAAMIADCGARFVYRGEPLADWMAEPDSAGVPEAAPGDPFNIIYSSGTTGVPKGVVQPNAMRWAHMQRGPAFGSSPSAITLVSTPLYSNTTLVSLLPALATGGTVVLMAKFDVTGYLELAERHRATHTMLVPVQYKRLLAASEFDRCDLASFRMKFSTSSHFAPELKRQALERWPGGLVEYYGLTEGGGTAILVAHEHPDKLHTVGTPASGHDIRMIDEAGRELPRGETGELVGHSRAMMTGYHRRPDETRAAEWFDASGKRFIRTGDIGRFDADGFVVLLDRRKDVIISGGFNIYAVDLETVLGQHPAVAEAAVVAMPSERWGETPFAFVVARNGATLDAGSLVAWANERLGRMQRLGGVRIVDELPRNTIGKVMKRELRAQL